MAIVLESTNHSCCNLPGALARLGDDQDLLCELARLFVDTLPDRIRDLTSSMEAGCPQAVSDAAHSLKGSVRYFLAEKAYDMAQALELLALSGTKADIESSAEKLLREVQRLEAELVNTYFPK